MAKRQYLESVFRTLGAARRDQRQGARHRVGRKSPASVCVYRHFLLQCQVVSGWRLQFLRGRALDESVRRTDDIRLRPRLYSHTRRKIALAVGRGRHGAKADFAVRLDGQRERVMSSGARCVVLFSQLILPQVFPFFFSSSFLVLPPSHPTAPPPITTTFLPPFHPQPCHISIYLLLALRRICSTFSPTSIKVGAQPESCSTAASGSSHLRRARSRPMGSTVAFLSP